MEILPLTNLEEGSLELLKNMKLRTINTALKEIKQLDANSSITTHSIRTWIKQNKIKSLCVGNKILLDFDDLLKLINFEK